MTKVEGQLLAKLLALSSLSLVKYVGVIMK